MQIEKELPLLEDILGQWEDVIGDDTTGYKNHCYRMLHFCFFLHDCRHDDKKKFIISACFHDLGLWTNKTVDYLPPSLQLAKSYLEENNLLDWIEEIGLMIDMHHKITAYNDSRFPLVEIFRRADRADFSLGLIKGGVSKDYIRQVKGAFPNAGFHTMLLHMQVKWLGKHPLNPFPVMKW